MKAYIGVVVQVGAVGTVWLLPGEVGEVGVVVGVVVVIAVVVGIVVGAVYGCSRQYLLG